MKTRQRIRKSDEPTVETTVVDATGAATHRLTDIEVNEVSIVDRAANRRKYLMVKSAKKPVAKAPPETGPAPQPPPAAPATPTPPTAPTLQISPELKAQVVAVLRTAQEQIGVISKVLEGASETPGAAPPKELMDALAQLSKLISMDGAATPPAAPPQPGAQPPQPPPPVTKEEAAKAGRKLSAANLEKLTTVRDAIAALISEASAEAETTPEVTPSTEPEVAKGKTPEVPNAELATVQTQLSEITDSVAKMTHLFGVQAAELANLKKAGGTSRQVELETESKPVEKKAVPVSWPMDMAKAPRAIQ